MQEEGLVKQVNGDVAKIAFVKKGGCGGGCSACKTGCPKDTLVIDLKNTKNASAGDRVLVDLDDKAFKNVAFWGYGFPTIVTVLALAISLFVFNKLNLKNYEVYSIFVALAAMIVSYKIGDSLNKGKGKFDFHMIKKL